MYVSGLVWRGCFVLLWVPTCKFRFSTGVPAVGYRVSTCAQRNDELEESLCCVLVAASPFVLLCKEARSGCDRPP